MVTFFSEPRDAFLTSVFRLLEVFACRDVSVYVSSLREGEARGIVNYLGNLFKDVRFEVYPLFPGPSDLKGFEDLQDRVLSSLKRFDDRWIVIASFSGSRLEVAATVLEASRVRDRVVLVYTPFFFGPWNRLFYPFTPKPLEPIVVLHPSSLDVVLCNAPDQVKNVVYGFSHSHVESLLRRFGVASKLRVEVAYAQHRVNIEYANTYAIYPTSFRCKPMEISVIVDGVQGTVARVGARDYCSYEEVVEAVNNLGKEVVEKSGMFRNDVGKSIELLAKFSAILLPTVGECTFDCSNYKGYLLTDFLSMLGEEALIDTNIVYSSIHTLLHEEMLDIKIPLCAYVEMLRHKAHYEKPYERLRSAIASLAVEELKALKLQIDERASIQPCEVGIALTNKLAITSDRKAYKEVFEEMKIKAILVEPKPIKEVKFVKREETRRIAYAYYAIAQLKALTSMNDIARALNDLGVRIEIK